MKSPSLAPQTGRIIEAISRLECIKPFVLVGGTALSIQLKTRQSEDLDFMRWKEGKDDTLDIGWPKIQKELETVGIIEDVQVAGFDQVLFIVDGVKVSFYAAPRKRIASMQEIPYMNNIRLADVDSIGIMKMEAMMRRSKFRDYYDIYSLLQAGLTFEEGLDYALKFTRHQVHSKAILSALVTPTLYPKPQDFDIMQPKYNISAEEMADYFMQVIASRKK